MDSPELFGKSWINLAQLVTRHHPRTSSHFSEDHPAPPRTIHPNIHCCQTWKSPSVCLFLCAAALSQRDHLSVLPSSCTSVRHLGQIFQLLSTETISQRNRAKIVYRVFFDRLTYHAFAKWISFEHCTSRVWKDSTRKKRYILFFLFFITLSLCTHWKAHFILSELLRLSLTFSFHRCEA